MTHYRRVPVGTSPQESVSRLEPILACRVFSQSAAARDVRDPPLSTSPRKKKRTENGSVSKIVGVNTRMYNFTEGASCKLRRVTLVVHLQGSSIHTKNTFIGVKMVLSCLVTNTLAFKE